MLSCYRKTTCIMIYGYSLCFTGRLQKKLRKAMFLSNRLHYYALSLAFHWWLVKWTYHYELLRTRSKSFKAKYYHCSVHTACTKINRSQQKFSILIHYFQADTFIPYGEHGWHDKYKCLRFMCLLLFFKSDFWPTLGICYKTNKQNKKLRNCFLTNKSSMKVN